MKRLMKILGSGILAAVPYFMGGVVLSYRRQPSVSRQTRDGFCAADLCSDTRSCDRARIIEDNTEALLLRLKMIGQAKERIILSTFEFRADESGKDVLAALLAAARRGVDVKILADGSMSIPQMDGNPYFRALASAENVEIRIYNRINLLKPWKSMGRLHDKYLIADRDLYVLGGRNTYDYFLGDNGYRNYDRDVLVYTPDPDRAESSIRQVENYFRSVWEMGECRPLAPWNTGRTASALEELDERWRTIRKERPDLGVRPDYAAVTLEVNRITLLSNPTHVYAKEPTLFYALTEIMKQCEGEVSIHTPYIICNGAMYGALREICGRKPHTRLLTNSVANNGNPFGSSDYQLNRDRLLDTGLEICEYEGGVSYHGKSISVGDRLAIVGSFNMDMRSVYLDTELMLVIDSEPLTGQLKEKMRMYEASAVKVLSRGREVVPEGVTRQELTAKKRWRIRILRLFNWFRFLM